MRRTSAVPLAALAVSVLLTLGLIAPLLAIAPWLVPGKGVEVITAARDQRPRRPLEGERTDTLMTASAVAAPTARQYVATFDQAAAPTGMTALPTPAGTRIYLNSMRIPETTPSWRAGALVAGIAAENLQAGRNRLEIITLAGPYRWPRAIFIGPLPRLESAAARLAWLGRWSLAITGVCGSAGALLGFLISLGRAERRPLIAPSLLALIFAGLTTLVWFETPGLTLTPWVWARLSLGAAAALLVLLMAGSEKDRWARWSTLALRACAVAVCLVVAAGPLSLLAQTPAAHLAHAAAFLAAVVGAGGGLALTLAGQGVRESWSPTRRALVALAALALLAAAVGRIQAFGPWGLLMGQPLAAVSAGMFTAGWVGWMAVLAFLDGESALQQRLGLASIIREQKARIVAQQAALELEIARRAVFEERERLSRDIHDGVGGSLVSLLLQARTGDLKDSDLEAALERSLEDLRLMVDALDHAPGALGVAFATLQTRISPAFKAAGIALDWRQDDLDGRALKDSRALLHVFRIMQEATTNVVRHSGARAARVRIGWDASGNLLVVEVEDDGTGAKAAGQGPGKGLRNMAERAQRIGGQLVVGPAPDGTGWRVRLQISGA